MKVWFRGAALAGAALLWMGVHVGAQIREIGGTAPAGETRGGRVGRSGQPVVLLNTREGEFVGGKRIVAQFILKQLDPERAASKVNPPRGLDGIIAYPGSRMLMVRGTQEAIASYRASLEKLDREAGAEHQSGSPAPGASEALAGRPVILLPAGGKLALKADHLVQQGATMRATGHVVIGLADGIELRARQVHVTSEGSLRRIVIDQ